MHEFAKRKGEEEGAWQAMSKVIQVLGDDDSDTINSAEREQLRRNLFIISDAIEKAPTTLRMSSREDARGFSLGRLVLLLDDGGEGKRAMKADELWYLPAQTTSLTIQVTSSTLFDGIPEEKLSLAAARALC
ncbi:hypothetical protein SCHPADRAFT_942422 [Schizopora paradoxa]|uniref:Uncharacterized protein n=1 Tax=Schizopora paradoxa TaxID=27342 RepID=A0A0H2RHI0_9AGAM|nr:hypothetical protein SCHPADRAFT_942422 [Schizopora paradoxa]